MYPTASAGPDQPTYLTDPAQLPMLLQQLVANLADSAVTYVIGRHYYERTNHPRSRHFRAVFTLRQDEVANVEVGPDFGAFDTEFIRYPERGELHYPGPWADRFRVTVPFAQLYQLCRKVLTPAEQAAEEVSYGPAAILSYNAAVYQQHPTPADTNQAYAAAPPSGEHPLVAVLTAVEAGQSNKAIKNQTKQKTDAMIERYTRLDDVKRFNAAQPSTSSCDLLLGVPHMRVRCLDQPPTYLAAGRLAYPTSCPS